MVHLRSVIAVLLLLTFSSVAQAENIGWQEAVARLAHERTRAETCARLLKRHGDEAAVSRGELAYGEAKAEIDAVLAGLAVALADNATPVGLPDLEVRLERGVKGREVFCAQVRPLMPDTAGERSVIIDLVSGALAPLIQAVQAIYLDYRKEDRDADRLIRATIQTQLEATTWPDFAAIAP